MGLLNALLLLATASTIPGEPCNMEALGTIVTTPCNMLMERLGLWYVSPPKSIPSSLSAVFIPNLRTHLPGWSKLCTDSTYHRLCTGRAPQHTMRRNLRSS